MMGCMINHEILETKALKPEGNLQGFYMSFVKAGRWFLIFRVIRDHSSRKRKLIFGETILWRTSVVNFVV